MKVSGWMICNMDRGLIIGLMVRSSTRLSRIFIRGVGGMGRGMGLAVSFTQMGASIRGILRAIRRMEKGWLWMRMAMLSWNILRRIS